MSNRESQVVNGSKADAVLQIPVNERRFDRVEVQPVQSQYKLKWAPKDTSKSIEIVYITCVDNLSNQFFKLFMLSNS